MKARTTGTYALIAFAAVATVVVCLSRRVAVETVYPAERAWPSCLAANFEDADLGIIASLKKGVALFDDEAERVQFEEETGYDLIDAGQWNPIGGSDDDDDDDDDDDI